MHESTLKHQAAETTVECAASIRNQLDCEWFGHIYLGKILARRNRSIHLDLPSRVFTVAIFHTLLGVELKVGRKRIISPDLSTARYLAVFARAGIPDFALPYDITQVPGMADELETSWQRMLLLIEQAAKRRAPSFARAVRRILTEEIRAEVAAAGAGTKIPEFRQSTRQRKSSSLPPK